MPQDWLAPFLGSHIILLLPLVINGTDSASALFSQKAVAEKLQYIPSQRVALYQDFEGISALAFYLKKPIEIVDSLSDDLLYGQKQHANPAMFPTLVEWAAQKPYVPMAVLKPKLFSLMDALHDQHVDLKHVCVVERFDRVVIVSMCQHGF